MISYKTELNSFMEYNSVYKLWSSHTQ